MKVSREACKIKKSHYCFLAELWKFPSEIISITLIQKVKCYVDTSQQFKKESMCRVMQIPRSCLKHYPRGYVKKLVSQVDCLEDLITLSQL